METGIKFKTVSEYLAMQPAKTRAMLQGLRKTIKEAAPLAEESISYNMPAFKLQGPLVYFAGYKNHIGFYPVSSGIRAFAKELSIYKGAKGSVQFPLDQPLPLSLVKKIVKYRLKENMEKAAQKSAKHSKKKNYQELKPRLVICNKGHRFYKSSDCPSCPACEKEGKPKEGLLSQLSAPARRALEGIGVTTVKKLSRFTEKEIMSLHGMGPSSLPILKTALAKEGLAFREKSKLKSQKSKAGKQ